MIDHETLFKHAVDLDGFSINIVRAVLDFGARGEAVEDTDGDAFVELLR